jgi:D-3-phosphoglycerate dehydrogenase
VVSEPDLIDALKNGPIAGADLDVFEKEPVGKDNPLLGMENLILTPHSAALTAECVVRMAVSAVQRVVDLFAGIRPGSIANPDVLGCERWKHLRES